MLLLPNARSFRFPLLNRHLGRLKISRAKACTSDRLWDEMVHGKRRGILVFSCVGVLLSVTIVLLVTANQAFATTRYFNEGTRAFTYINYRSCVQEIKRLNEQYPDLVEIGNAQEKYGVRSPGDCGGEPCTQWFLRITNEATLRKTRPEVFFSGSLHGNEEIGPTTTIEFARLLLENYKFGKNPWLKRLVNTRSIYIMPSANAWGYFHETRVERLDGKSMDPNRDFGYLHSCVHETQSSLPHRACCRCARRGRTPPCARAWPALPAGLCTPSAVQRRRCRGGSRAPPRQTRGGRTWPAEPRTWG